MGTAGLEAGMGIVGLGKVGPMGEPDTVAVLGKVTAAWDKVTAADLLLLLSRYKSIKFFECDILSNSTSLYYSRSTHVQCMHRLTFFLPHRWPELTADYHNYYFSFVNVVLVHINIVRLSLAKKITRSRDLWI
jgi:hypothetical protein